MVEMHLQIGVRFWMLLESQSLFELREVLMISVILDYEDSNKGNKHGQVDYLHPEVRFPDRTLDEQTPVRGGESLQLLKR